MSEQEAIDILTSLPDAQKREAIRFIEALATVPGLGLLSRPAGPSEVPAREPERFAETFSILSAEDADEIEKIIEEQFERIDQDEWKD